MKKISIFSKVATVVAILAVLFSFASCDLFSGSLELKAFTVDRSSVKTNYLIGEEIDFSGIKASVRYSDETLDTMLTYDDLKVIYDEDITATAGDKVVTVTYDDPNLNKTIETKVPITISAEPIISDEPLNVVQYTKPASLISFDSANSEAGTLEYGQDGFSGQFARGGFTYVIGNDNVFKFNPKLTVSTDNGYDSPTHFYSVVEISIDKDGEFVPLTAKPGEGNDVQFFDGDAIIVTVDTYKGEYRFSDSTDGIKVQISVLPSEKYFVYDGNTVVLVADIVNGYNIYEAWELALIDTDLSDERGYKLDDARIWESFKEEHGINNVTVSGIILHNNLTVTASDIPDAFLHTATEDVEYTNTITGKKETVPAGTQYLLDWSEIYRRSLNPNESFLFEGNLFTIDFSQFPVVASPGVFNLEGNDDDYGTDFSNATLFKFINNNDAAVEDYSKITFRNANIIGNAAIDSKIDSTGALASAGGVIFMKTNQHINTTCSNVIGNSFFITYFCEYKSIFTANDVKCFDSYQNAVFLFDNNEAYFNDSYLYGSGGPVVICSSPKVDSNSNVYTQPMFIANNTVVETHVTGNEIWFTAVGANTIVGQILGLSQQLSDKGFGSLVDNNKLNIQGLIMASGDNADEIVGGVGASGAVTIDGKGFSRLPNDATWQTIGMLYQANPASMAAPFLTIKDSKGNAHTLFFDGTYLRDLSNNIFNPDPTNGGSTEHLAIYQALKSADTLSLTQGGITVVFEFYH